MRRTLSLRLTGSLRMATLPLKLASWTPYDCGFYRLQMPADDHLRLHDHQTPPPVGETTKAGCPEEVIRRPSDDGALPAATTNKRKDRSETDCNLLIRNADDV
jgi:hypothetical protein